MSDLLVDASPAARRTSAVLALVAAIALFGDCLLTSPPRFSDKHHEDTSLLKPVITALAVGGAFPTYRGVEIKNLMFYVGAAVLAFVAGLRLVSTDRRPRVSGDDLLDVRRRAASPYFWWLLLILASVLSSMFSHAPEVCKGQTIIRFLHLAWWWPLAALLAPKHVHRLITALLVALGVMAALGIWYYVKRNDPGSRLQYSLGNELYVAACLLPGVFIVVGLGLGVLTRLVRRTPCEADHDPTAGSSPSGLYCGLQVGGLAIASGLILAAMWLTRSRSAAAGLVAGAFTVVCYTTRKKTRLVVLLLALICAIAGAVWMQDVRTGGVMGQRAHSIRVRLNYQWPYALALFFQKPVLGHGDGAYSMLAGRFARQDQLDDPGTISFDESSWIAQAHNEVLHLMADLGVVGALAFVAAIVLTLFRALQYCDRMRGDRSALTQRALAIGLAAALVALAVDECFTPAFREVGLPPILLTIWAGLWALVRVRPEPVKSVPDDERLGNMTLRLGGVAVGVCAVILCYLAVLDWRGARANFQADAAMKAKNFPEAIRHADVAGENLLNPFRKISARTRAIWARSNQFTVRLDASELPPSDQDIAFAQEALARLDWLTTAAPRFLTSASLKANLSRNLMRAYQRRGQSEYAQAYRRKWIAAMEQHRADEPFRVDVVAELWRLEPRAPTVQRLLWLRSLLRDSGINQDVFRWFQEMRTREDFDAVMLDLLNIAARDRTRAPSQWMDRLSPETFRVAALATAYVGQSADAAQLADKAVALYEEAGPRLFTAHAAALHEKVQYSFNANPTAGADERLELLARARAMLAPPADPATPLPGAMGHTRLRVLLAAGREKEARTQLDVLDEEGGPSLERRQAEVYWALADQFAVKPPHAAEALAWALRGRELAPDAPEGCLLLAQLFLHRGDDAQALDAANRYLGLMQDRQAAYEALGRVESRYPGGAVWPELRRRHPDLPPAIPASTQPARATTQPVPVAPVRNP